MQIEYRANTANAVDIKRHFKNCDALFLENLSKRINIDDYSLKIELSAQRFEFWANNQLIGLLAAYFNDTTNKVGYITNVSITSLNARRGLASQLLKKCIEYAKSNNFTTIKLEVHQDNSPAINLYSAFNFIEINKKNAFLTLQLTIK